MGHREPCTKCGMPVFIAERLLVGGHLLYHRTCFRCARCQHQLSLANFYETEGGEYCCETCPDEVLDTQKKSQEPSQNHQTNLDMIGHAGPEDAYSADFESALEKSAEQEQHFFKTRESAFSIARSHFMSKLTSPEFQSEAECQSTSDNEESSAADKQVADDSSRSKTSLSPQAGSPERQSINHAKSSNVDVSSKDEVYRENSVIKTAIVIPQNSDSGNNDTDNDEGSIKDRSSSKKLDVTPIGEGSASLGNNDITSSLKYNGSKEKQLIIGHSLSSEDSDVNVDITAKEENSDSPSSIVKMRLKLFEKNGKSEEITKALKTLSNRKYVLGRKDESSSTQLNSHVSRSVSDKTTPDTDEKLMSPEKQELSNDKINFLKEKSEFVINDQIQNASAPLNAEFQSNSSAVPDEHGSGDRIEVSTTINDRIDQDKADIIKDISPADKDLESHDVDRELEPRDLDKDLESLGSQSKMPITPGTTPDRNEDTTSYPEELNPFGDDEEDDNYEEKKITEKVTDKQEDSKETRNLNPFGSTDDEEEEEEVKVATKPPRPPLPVIRQSTLPHTQRMLEAPKVSLNPFWSDGEEQSTEDESADSTPMKGERTPVPLPRTVKGVSPEPCPVPRKSLVTNTNDKFGSVSSLSSLNSSPSGTTSRKKKKPAPAPPRAQDLFPDLPAAQSPGSSRASSPCPSLRSSHSPRATPRHRKSRPAPLPPATSQETSAVPFSEAKLIITQQEDAALSSQTTEWEREKNKKDVANRNRQSQSSSRNSFDTLSPSELLGLGPNKSTFGQWKRKKGPAPPRPVPQRRQIKAIPMQEVRRELDDIEVQQQELERQGVTLEKTIRNKFDQVIDPGDDTSMTPDVEDLVLQLFELVNEKNELFRRQAELMYLRRQQRLEEEHADLEYQIRCLMELPEHRKTDSDKQREEELIQRLVEVVERRNEIVECLEMDRIREAEEDRSIHARLGMLSRGKTLHQDEVIKPHSGKQKKKKKDKEKNIYKRVMKVALDVDKDIDEREEAVPKHMKEKKTKRKWF
ncbi:MICAL-like protein 2 isoform X2 [Periplaneta americana]